MGKRILFLFSDTGGGHRASTNAIIEGLNLEFPGRYDTDMVDFLREYSPAPLRYSPEIYPPLSRARLVWKGTFAASNGPRRNQAMSDMTYPYVRRQFKKMLREREADVIVSVHPLANGLIPRAMRKNPVPYVTVVTDMVTAHAAWYSPRADLIVVPTAQARNRGIRLGIDPERLRVVGQPVSPKFATLTTPKERLRAELGWPADEPVVLVLGGGDGMGPLRRVVKALNDAVVPATLAVICGRNEALREELTDLDWHIPHRVYGFTTDMPMYMKAADIFLTKAGPGSISEAFISGLPIVMYACLPGQEEGNVDYVLDGGAGMWAPRAKAVVEAVRYLAQDPVARGEYAAASARLARPNAAREIAHVLAEVLGDE